MTSGDVGSRLADCDPQNIEKCFDTLWLRDIMYDLGNNGVRGRLCRIILLNKKRRRRIAVKTEEIELGELVRQGSVLGAVISANYLETVVKDTQYGFAVTTMGNIILYPICFIDDVASVLEALKNQVMAVEIFQGRKRLQLPE